MSRGFWAVAAILLVQNITLVALYGRGVVSIKSNKDIQGIYKLSILQSQDSKSFKPMKDIEIIKIFADGAWISPAYDKTTKRVVSLSGGSYVYNPAKGLLIEKVLYNQRDLSTIGSQTSYKLELDGSGFYQSGVYKQGRSDAWKVEEIWARENAY